MTPQALIFDFNGLIVDDEPVHCELFRLILQDEDITLSEKEYWEDYLGFDDKGLLEAVYAQHQKKLTPKKLHELIEKKNQLYFPVLQKRLRLFPGVVDFIQEMVPRVPLALVSGALRSEIDFVLTKAGLEGIFDPLVSADDTKHGKPDPEGYVLAYLALKKKIPTLLPETCLVLEDSLSGIEAAKRAGMKVAALTHTYPAEKLGQADWIVSQFSEVKKHLIF